MNSQECKVVFAQGRRDGLRSQEIQWSQYLSYAELIDRAVHTTQRIRLRFLTPTSFRRGRVDFPLPEPRLVFQSYRKRFTEFYQVAFLPDFEEQVEYHTGISNIVPDPYLEEKMKHV